MKAPSPPTPRYATVAGTAEYMRAHPNTVRQLIRAHKLRAYRGAGDRLIRIDLNDVDALMGVPAASVS